MSGPRGASGFSLAEVIVALFLLVAGVAGVAAMLAHTTRFGRNSIDRSMAQEVLREKVEELRTLPYADLGGGGDSVRAVGVAYAREWTVNSDVPTAGVKEVHVRVSWTEGVTPAPQTDLDEDGDLVDAGRLRLTAGLAHTLSRERTFYRAAF